MDANPPTCKQTSMTNLQSNLSNHRFSTPREPLPPSFVTFKPVRILLPLTDTAEWS